MKLPISILMLALAVVPATAQVVPRANILKQKQLKQKGKQQGKQGKQPDAIERFLAMPPEQQRRMLQQLPPERRRQLQQTLRAMELLSPEERNLLRGRAQRFADFPPERQGALRDEIQYLRRLMPEDRRRRMNADDFRQKWSSDELQLLDEVTGQQDARQREE